jgi:hypothetical protein
VLHLALLDWTAGVPVRGFCPDDTHCSVQQVCDPHIRIVQQPAQLDAKRSDAPVADGVRLLRFLGFMTPHSFLYRAEQEPHH